jgi:YidC/Oxa1 family membrane protein insertase
VELRHAGFLPVWITDLAAPDALISFSSPIHVPLANWTLTSFNLLPILLTIAMILQQKFTPMSSATMDEQQARQQKRMMYFMNGFFLLIFYNMPSGLNLYIMSSTFAGVAEQWVIRRHIQQRKADEAARETQIVVPGKASRLSRPKKPKGPFRG